MINILTFILLLAVPASALPTTNTSQEIPRLEPLTEILATAPAAGTPDPSCTGDKRWCVFLSQDTDLNTVSVIIYDGRKPLDENGKVKDAWTYSVGNGPDAPGGFDNAAIELWPQIIREPSSEPTREGEEAGENISIGMLSINSTMYSGGGARSEQLTLYRLPYSPYGKPAFQEMLDVPWNAAVMIRACFSEADMKNRNGACHDLYDFDATLKLDSAYPKDSPPRLIYQTKATATPGNSRRSEDNSSGKKLSDKDILPRADDECTYTRGVRYNPVTARYEFDRPGPDCSEYTVP
jgi:hypothetical protein